ncbi:hydantoinase/oxoprolinase family protein [Corynebacterium sp. A21]|uniref:hydantoinase/oxoprolinase family protein n=1 Tax=Corynebacterium sp. A21 TaxID=3457318 RepID=UPI003FD5BCC0
MSTTELQVAVDTGGTFTDIGVRRADGSMAVWKVPSTPHAPDEAVITGLLEAMERQGADPTHIARLVHGTTVATNTVLTRTGARVGLLTTEGFGDLLAIAHQARPALYDARITRVAPLVPGALVTEIAERMAADGSVLQPLNEQSLAAAAAPIRELELDILVVSFLNAYVNPAHEQRAVALLTKLGVAPRVTAATAVTAEMREYERTSTAVVNAFVQPKIASYLSRLNAGIEELAIPSKLWIMQSNGGLLSPSLASEHSARTVLSGLAGGVVGAANWSRLLGLDHTVSFDIGGTSTDIALIRHGQPEETMSGEIDSLPLRLPAVAVHTIGAGGGSIAWRDSGGGLRVGPQSAGADPGPVSYDQGGRELTVTDAHLVLGRLGDSLLGGRFALDRATAYTRMKEWGAELGMGPEDTAAGILAVIAATMARGIRRVSVEQGVDVRSCHLIAFGGAGPLHGGDLAVELGMRSAVIPPTPGIASAVGMLDAPVRHDFAVPVAATETTGSANLAQDFKELESRATAEMAAAEIDFTRQVDARYIGQSYELTIDWHPDWATQRTAFDTAHEQRYGFHDPAATMEIVVARLVATLPQPEVTQPYWQATGSGTPDPKTHREVYIDGRWRRTPIYDRQEIPAGMIIEGPAIIDQFDSTTYVRPDQDCRCDDHGFLHLSRKEDAR